MRDGLVVIPLDDRERWDAAHRDGGLPSQSWQYAHALSAAGLDPRLAVVSARGARMLIPFIEREWHGRIDITTTPGLSGASLSAESAAPLALWRDYACAQGWVAGYLQLAVGAEPRGLAPSDAVITPNEVFVLDLRRDDLLSTMARTVRAKLRAAEAAGVMPCEDTALLTDALVRLHPETIARGGAASSHRHNAATLRRWARDPTSVLVGGGCGAAVDAVILACVAGHRAELHILGTTTEARNLTAWLYVQAIERLRARGVETLNLGGGARPGDGIAQFKAWFGGTRRGLRAVTQIYDADAYESFCLTAPVTANEGYFPAYRGS